MWCSTLLLALVLLLAGCSSVVIIQRSVPRLGDQVPPLSVTIPKDQKPVVVKEEC
jgi:hypothetical protein